MADLQDIPKLAEWTPSRYVSSAAKVEDSASIMAAGSENVMLAGSGKPRAFKGMNVRVSQFGGFVMQNVAEGFASIGQASDITAYGSVFNVYSALFYIGKGLVRLNGTSLGVNASATLSFLLKRSGSYTDPLSGPWQAGLAQPSAPVVTAITPPPGFTGKNNGVVAVGTHRIRSTTGAVSIVSPASAPIATTNQSVAVQLPLPDANGQDYWGIDVTKNGEGQDGSLFQYQEIPESFVSETITRTNTSTTAASDIITSAGANFTSEQIGWKVVLSGGAPAVSLTTYVIAVPGPTQLQLAAPVASNSTGVNASIRRGVAGAERTIVVEWRDGDLVGSEFAPTRAFAPPEGLLASALEDVVYVDGAYADAVADTSPTAKGSAIAPSEPGRPENFSPDTVIFTNDVPVALLKGESADWRLCRNSTFVVRYLGGEKPISVEPVWTGFGIQHQHNAVVGEGGRLYMWPTERGPLRLGQSGTPEGFATDIEDDLIGCTDPLKRVLGWDANKQVVVICYEGKIWPYFTALERFGAPADISGMIAGDYIKSAVTVDGQLLLTDDLDNIYEYDVGTGSVMIVRTGWAPSRFGEDTVALVLTTIRADNFATDVTIDVYADGDDTAPVSSITVDVARTGFQRLPAVWPNVTSCSQHAIQVTITSNTANGDCGLERVETFGDGDNILY